MSQKIHFSVKYGDIIFWYWRTLPPSWRFPGLCQTTRHNTHTLKLPSRIFEYQRHFERPLIVLGFFQKARGDLWMNEFWVSYRLNRFFRHLMQDTRLLRNQVECRGNVCRAITRDLSIPSGPPMGPSPICQAVWFAPAPLTLACLAKHPYPLFYPDFCRAIRLGP